MAAPADPAQLAGLSLLLRAPSKDAVAAVFAALFAQRHGAEAARAEAVGALLALSADEAAALASAAGALLRRALYESSELPTLEAVRALVPAELDGRLASLVAGVRPCAARCCLHACCTHYTQPLYLSLCRACAHPCNTLPPPRAPSSLPRRSSQVLHAGLPGWREAAVGQRVGLPQLEGVSWSVLAVNSTSATASANEAALRLRLSVRDQPTADGVMPASRDVFVAVSPASLGALLEGMRKVKEQLGAFS